MRRIIYTLYLFVNATCAFSQNANIITEEGAIIEYSNSQTRTGLKKLGKIGNKAFYLAQPFHHYYSINTLGNFEKSYGIIAYDIENKEIEQMSLPIYARSSDTLFQNAFFFGSEIFLIYSYWTEKDVRILMDRLDPVTLKLRNEPKQIYQVNNDFKERDNSFKSEVEFSLDNSKILLWISFFDKEQRVQKVLFHVFDKSMQLLWNDHFSASAPDGTFSEIIDYKLHIDGEIMAIALTYPSKEVFDNRFLKEGGAWGQPLYYKVNNDYKTLLLRFSKEIDRKSEKIIKNSSGFIRSAGVFLKGDTIGIIAVVSGLESINNQAVQLLLYNKTNFEFLADDEIAFNEKNKGTIDNPKEQKAFDKSLGSELNDPFFYQLNEIFEDVNGRIYLILEQKIYGGLIERAPVGQNSYGTFVTDLVKFGDLLIIELDSFLQINKLSRVEKRQMIYERMLLDSYCFVKVENDMHFLYNNFTEMNDSKQTIVIFGDVFHFASSEDELLRKEKLYTYSSKNDFFYHFKEALEIAPNVVLIPAMSYYGKSLRFDRWVLTN